MTQENRLAAIFLQEFTRELIVSSSPIEIPKPKEIKIKKLSKREIFEFKNMIPSQFQIKKEIPLEHLRHMPYIPPVKRKTLGAIKNQITQKMQASLRPSSRNTSFPRPEGAIPFAKPALGAPDLKKINFLTSDPQIRSIECPGPNKNILVKKGGQTQKTQIVLTKEEIEGILNEFSTKTRIPLIGGTFKAALGNLIITAVTSEFVGDRFIIQKKNPFAPIE